MIGKTFQITTFFLLMLSIIVPTLSQQLVCKTAALAALKPLPKLKYKCSEDLTESDDAVLTQPNRLKAIELYTKSLEKFVYADWWKTSVEDLNLCDFRKKAGVLSREEKQQYEGGEYYFHLGGNNQFRFIIADDPCYQQGFSGSDIFLLNRVGGKVFASEIIDGFYTRADFPLGFDYAFNGKETIIEIATTSGGLYPTESFYYFTIDKKTNRAVPKKLFKDNGKLTNRIYSDMILGEPEEYGLPRGSKSLQIIKNKRLAKSFYVFEDTLEDFEGQNHKFIRVLFKWNGKFYE
ncbi:MAG TPA: hypothetical protein VNB22_01280 [Pyrinomonadaceae bacterium]|nr:hypothetical protein [Pyrinomonadaceae bacterium]